MSTSGYSLAYGAFLVVPRPVLFAWYYPPLIVAVALQGAMGAQYAWVYAVNAYSRRRPSRDGLGPCPGRRAIRTAAGLLIWVLVLAPLVARWPNHIGEAVKMQRFENELRKPIGVWLEQNTVPDAVVATEPIGYIGYYSKRPILDEVGLVSPMALPSRALGDGWFADLLRRAKPEYCVERTLLLNQNQTITSPYRPFRGDADRTWFSANYVPVAVFSLPRSRWYSQDPGRHHYTIYCRRDHAYKKLRIGGAPRTTGREGH